MTNVTNSITSRLKYYRNGGAMRDRTADPLRARQVLSQLSYSPIFTCLFIAMRRCACLAIKILRKT